MTTQEMWHRLTRREQDEVLSDTNIFFTGLALKRSPTVDDLVRHYFENTSGPHLMIHIFEVVEEPADVQNAA